MQFMRASANLLNCLPPFVVRSLDSRLLMTGILKLCSQCYFLCKV